jgi:hypothetical protein
MIDQSDGCPFLFVCKSLIKVHRVKCLAWEIQVITQMHMNGFIKFTLKNKVTAAAADFLFGGKLRSSERKSMGTDTSR